MTVKSFLDPPKSQAKSLQGDVSLTAWRAIQWSPGTANKLELSGYCDVHGHLLQILVSQLKETCRGR